MALSSWRGSIVASAVICSLLAGCVSSDGSAEADATDGPTTSCGAEWSAAPSLQVPRTEAAAVAAAGKLWVLGGLFDFLGGGPEGLVDVYDPATGVWSPGPTLPLPLHHMGVVVVGDTIVVTGGFIGAPQFVAFDNVWTLDAQDPDGVWLPGPAMPTARGGHTAVTDGASIWIFGGVVGTAVYATGGTLLLDRTVWRLDFADGSPVWLPQADIPFARDHLTGGFLDGKVYAVGGRSVTLQSITGRVDVLDPATGTWAPGPAMPTPRAGIGAAVVCGSLCVVGGEAPGGTFDETECLDPATASWSSEPLMPLARHGVGVAGLDGAMYVVAGGPQPAYTYSTDVQRFGP